MLNNIFVILLLMIFFHIVDDYYLQGILAKMKQISWWETNAPDKRYKHDYVVALFMHAFSWTFLVMLPILIAFSFNPPLWYFLMFIPNIAIHGLVDDLKCNRFKLNLVQDQLIHIIQILLTWGIYLLWIFI